MGLIHVSVVFSDRKVVQEASFLGHFIEMQKKSIDYMGHVLAYHMDQISDEEMDAIDDEFSFQPQKIELKDIVFGIQTLLKYTKVDFTPSELSSHLQVDDGLLNDALKNLPEYAMKSLESQS